MRASDFNHSRDLRPPLTQPLPPSQNQPLYQQRRTPDHPIQRQKREIPPDSRDASQEVRDLSREPGVADRGCRFAVFDR